MLTNENLCIAALAERGDHLCQLELREDGHIPSELWSWSVYINGNVHRRGPGSTRRDSLKWYATLPKGEHRIVIREAGSTRSDRLESNTLFFAINDQLEILINVSFREGGIVLSVNE